MPLREPLLFEQLGPLWRQLFQNEIRQRVIQDVLEEGESGQESRAGDFLLKIQNLSAGNDDPEKLEEVMEKVCDPENEDQTLFQELLLLWKEIHQGLMDRIREFYTSTTDGREDFSSLDLEESIQYSHELAQSFLQYCPQFDANRVFFLTVLFLVERESTKKRQVFSSLTHERLQQFLQEIASWSPFHLAWDEIDSFILSLENLSGAKIALGKQKQQEMRQALLDLAADDRLLHFFDVQEITSWRIQDIPRDKIEDTYSRFFIFKTALDSYLSLLHKKPSTITQRKEMDERFFSLEEEIGALFANLRPVFERKEEEVLAPVKATPGVLNQKLFSQAEELGPEWENIYALVEKGDFSGAYWLARSQGEESIYPLLFKAVQGSWWFPGHEGIFYHDLKELFQALKGQHGTLQRLIIFSASILPVFFAPQLVEEDFLFKELQLPVLDEFVERMHQFKKEGYFFRLEDLPGHQGMLEREMKIGAFVKKARNYLESGRVPQLSYQSFLLLKRLLKPGSHLYSILKLVAGDERDEYQRLTPLLSQWEETTAMMGTLKRFSANGVEEDLIHYLWGLVRTAFGWYYMMEQDEGIRGDTGYLKRLEDFSNFVILKSTPLLLQIDTLLQEEELGLAVRLGLHCVRASFVQLDQFFNPAKKEEGEKVWWIKDSTGLEESLSRRLLWIPQLEKGSLEIPLSSSLQELQPAFFHPPATLPNLLQVLPQWKEKGDFRFTHRILDAFPTEETRDLRQELEQEQQKKQKEVKLHLHRAQERVEQAYQGGAMEETRRFFLKGRLHTPQEALNFQSHLEVVEEVQKELEDLLAQELKKKEETWDDLRSRFREGRGVPCLEEMKRAFNKQDLLTIHRYLKALDHYLETGSGEFLPANPYLTSFMKQVYGIERYAISDSRFRLLSRSLQKGSTWGNMDFGHLSESQREEAEKSLKAYMQMKKRPFSRGDNLISSLQTILSFTGFHFFATQKESFRVLSEQEDWIHLQVRMSPGRKAFPFPHFGSLTHGNYQLLCLQEKPGTDTLGSFLQSTLVEETEILLILYLGRLTGYQRHQLLKANRERRVVSAVMDELLFLHLLGRSRERLQAFLHCSQPFSSLIPYLPDRDRGIPQEIFFGRSGEKSRILHEQGITLLCGGLKTGKTALLHHIQGQVHHPEMDRFATVLSLKDLPEVPGVQEFFQLLKTTMNRWGFTQEENGTIPQQIQQVMAKNPQLKVFLFFDDADDLLQGDEAREIIPGLQEILQECGDRFKMVFSGSTGLFPDLQNPSESITPLVLGPLSPGAGAELVEKPLEALGFVLEAEARQFLLSRSEGNPYLLQSFCLLLLRKLYEHHDRFRNLRNDGIPISLEDVKQVYPDFLQIARKRFEKTLELDPRYEVLVLGILADMKYNGYSSQTPYRPGQITNLLKILQPQGDFPLQEEEVTRLLQELEILDVISWTGEGQVLFRYGDLIPYFMEDDLGPRLKEALLQKTREGLQNS